MTTAVQPVKNIALAMHQFTDEQVALVKSTLLPPGCTDDELKLFLYVAQKTGLDPFSKQIHGVKRKQKNGSYKLTIQTAIDGFRLIATRTGCYAGRDEAILEYNKEGLLIRCKITAYRLVQGVRCAFTATALWDEYYPGDELGFMWKKLPETMLEKCCEAKVLRMAFPAELSGVYGDEEMAQADRATQVHQKLPQPQGPPSDAPASTAPPKPTIRTREIIGAEILQTGDAMGFSRDEIFQMAREQTGADSNKMTTAQMERFLQHLHEITKQTESRGQPQV